MAKVKIELNSTGVRSLLKSEEMAALLKAQADAIAGRCGTGYVTDTKQMGTRVIASVSTGTPEAMRSELGSNAILRALQ